MTRGDVIIQSRNDFSPAEIGHLEDGLYEFNRNAIGRHDGLGLGFAATDSDGTQFGAIAGYSWAGMAEIKQLWVAKSHRGFGHGRALLEAFIAEAIIRKCKIIWVVSHAFQAPGLYEKCGFQRVTTLAGWPPGHSLVVLNRWLPPA